MGKSLIPGCRGGVTATAALWGGHPGTWHVGCGVRGLEGAAGRAARGQQVARGKGKLPLPAEGERVGPPLS